jgi:hypothetical protein
LRHSARRIAVNLFSAPVETDRRGWDTEVLVPASPQRLLLIHRGEHSWPRSFDPRLTLHDVNLASPNADSHPRVYAGFGVSAPRAPFAISANPVFVTWNRRDGVRQIDSFAKPVTSQRCHWVALEQQLSSCCSTSSAMPEARFNVFTDYLPPRSGTKDRFREVLSRASCHPFLTASV